MVAKTFLEPSRNNFYCKKVLSLEVSWRHHAFGSIFTTISILNSEILLFSMKKILLQNPIFPLLHSKITFIFIPFSPIKIPLFFIYSPFPLMKILLRSLKLIFKLLQNPQIHQKL